MNPRAARKNFLPFYTLVVAYTTTIDKFIAVLFIKSILPFFGTNFVGGASEDLSASAKFDSRSGEKHDRNFAYTSFVL